MARELTIPIGVLAEKRKAKSRWIDEIWMPVGITAPDLALQTGQVLVSDDTMTRYFMGVHDLVCHAAETEAYVHNFNSRTPSIFVVMRRTEAGEGILPYHIHTVTASPYQSQDHDDAGEDIVERVPMPEEIEVAIKQFCDVWHQEEVFRKRRKNMVDEEKHMFGQEPIWVLREKRSEAGKK